MDQRYESVSILLLGLASMAAIMASSLLNNEKLMAPSVFLHVLSNHRILMACSLLMGNCFSYYCNFSLILTFLEEICNKMVFCLLSLFDGYASASSALSLKEMISCLNFLLYGHLLITFLFALCDGVL